MIERSIASRVDYGPAPEGVDVSTWTSTEAGTSETAVFTAFPLAAVVVLIASAVLGSQARKRRGT